MRLDSFVPKINILLSLGVIILAVYLALTLLKPYNPRTVSGGNIKLEMLALKSSAPAKEIPIFEEGIFKKKQLFSQSLQKKTEEKKIELMLLGVSVGDKNLAMIRDITANKDYYCVEGDRIGNFQVKQIFKDKVILESEGKTLEIRQ
jgi:type II secretory pathway component PulC